jgi:formylglycine-generating enzyme required for sulfatase activity
MSASAATRLRQLATQHHGGELDLQTYRRLRAELLDRLTNTEGEAEGNITLPQRPRPAATAPAPAVPTVSMPSAAAPLAPPPQPPPAVPARATSVSPARTAGPRRPGLRTSIVVALVAVIAMGAGGYFLLRPTTASPDATAESAEDTPESYLAINDFLAADDWSDEQIANFNARWATMPEEVRDAALEQPWYQNFVQRVRSRVKEQRALTATADSAGTVEGPLSALASSVGIDVSAPDAIMLPRKRREAANAGERQHHAAGASHAASLPATAPARSASATIPAAKGGAAAPTAANRAKAAVAPHQAAHAGANAAPQAVAESSNPDRCRIELVGSRRPRCRDALSIGGFGPFLAVIRPGGFDMGSEEAAQEGPVHHVTIARPFAIAEFEASQAEYRLFCTETRRSCTAQPWSGDDLPVVRVSWQDARDYVAWLSRVSGKNYRLATEAEWEYAARSGGTALFPSGTALSPTDAVFSQADRLTAPWPRSRKINANAFRLYHSIGNVREWVEDAWSASFTGAPDDGSARETADTGQRVVRGGAYTDVAASLRFTTREGIDPQTRDTLTGFRIVREM